MICAFKITISSRFLNINALKIHDNKTMMQLREAGWGMDNWGKTWREHGEIEGGGLLIDDQRKSKGVKMKAGVGGWLRRRITSSVGNMLYKWRFKSGGLESGRRAESGEIEKKITWVERKSIRKTDSYRSKVKEGRGEVTRSKCCYIYLYVLYGMWEWGKIEERKPDWVVWLRKQQVNNMY